MNQWNRTSRAGFTLLELLTVMAIMLMLMGMVMGSYYGFLRGAGLTSAVTNVRSTLSLARQFAVTHRCKTHVLFWQDGTNAHYVVCMQEGQQQNNASPLKVYPPRWKDGELVGQEVFNLTTSTAGLVSTNGTDYLTASNSTGVIAWNRGDHYGWAIRAQAHLPEGIAFGDGKPASAPPPVLFNSDGTTPVVAAGYYSILVKEQYPTNSAGQKEIRVQGLTGQVQVMP